MKVMTMATNDRWRIACHEAGHCIAALELGGTCNGAVLTAAGGQAFVDGLYADRQAFMVAAGPAAESIADRYEPPAAVSVVSPAELASASLQDVDRDLATACSFADLESLPRSAASDSHKLALWSITGREEEPESWAGRVAFAKRVAAEIVNKNARAIVEIAKSLYVAGRLTGEEIKSLLRSQSNVGNDE
jgi:hypothetical protein